MARTNTIQVIRTTRANLDAQATAGALLIGEPYFITDEARFAIGTSTTTYQTYAKESEAGSSGPITPEQLPVLNTYYGDYEAPSQVSFDQYGRITNVLKGAARATSKGAWVAPTPTKTYDFNNASNLAPREFDYSGPVNFLSTGDGNGGTIRVLNMPVATAGGVDTGSIRLNTNTTASTTFTITYRVTAAQGSLAFIIFLGNSAKAFETASTGFKTATFTIPAGQQQVRIAYQNSDPRGGDGVVISSVTIPNQGYIFGDVVSYSGANWQCLTAGTTETPGSGTAWTQYGGGGGGSAPPSHPGYVIGNWYSPQLDTVQRDAQPFANNLYARPILIGANTKMDGLALSTGYSASIGFTSTTAYLALYNSANGLPTTRVAYGQVSMSATSTACSVSFAATTLAPGWYWLAYVAAARTIVVSNPTTSFSTNHLVGASTPPSGTGSNGIAATYSYAIPPATFPSSTYQVADLPIVSWRASA